jgi:hypothetical protein
LQGRIALCRQEVAEQEAVEVAEYQPLRSPGGAEEQRDVAAAPAALGDLPRGPGTEPHVERAGAHGAGVRAAARTAEGEWPVQRR